jgi:hypothetical protein
VTYPQDPYGGQQPGSYPQQQSGGYPQQQPGGYPHQSGGYPQQPAGYGYPQPPGHHQQPGGYGAPPKKSKTGLIVGLAGAGALVIALIAFAITGFVAPGFLLSDDETAEAAPPAPEQDPNLPPKPEVKDPGDAPPPPDGPAQPASDEDVERLAQEFVAAINDEDKDGAMRLVCDDARSLVERHVVNAISDRPVGAAVRGRMAQLTKDGEHAGMFLIAGDCVASVVYTR